MRMLTTAAGLGKAAVTAGTRAAAATLGRGARLRAGVTLRRHGPSTRPPGQTRRLYVDGVLLSERFVVVDGYRHLVTEAGDPNAPEAKTVVCMGGVPTDSSETFHWLVAELCNQDPSLRCVILHLPFMEEETEISLTSGPWRYAELGGATLPFGDPIDLSDERLDIRYDHKYQAEVAADILAALEITSAHLVGHDRGAVVFDHLLVAVPTVARSYSRGAQVWDTYDDAWSALAPELIVGPPHRLMVEPWQCRALFFAVIRVGKPIALLSPGFVRAAGDAEPGSETYNRLLHLTLKTLDVSDRYLAKMRQIFMQTDTTIEVASRADVKATWTPIMQFQGEDEFLVDERGTLVSDQPYFGVHNLFPNDVEDLYPGAVGQDPTVRQSHLVADQGPYKLLQLKPAARLSRFALIPDAAHFNVVENPTACAAAIHDFVTACNEV